jgi:hypothetical protein
VNKKNEMQVSHFRVARGYLFDLNLYPLKEWATWLPKYPPFFLGIILVHFGAAFYWLLDVIFSVGQFSLFVRLG